MSTSLVERTPGGVELGEHLAKLTDRTPEPSQIVVTPVDLIQ